MEHFSGFRKVSVFDNELDFWGFRIISEMFPVFYDKVEDVSQGPQLSCHWFVIGVPSLHYSPIFDSFNQWMKCDTIYYHYKGVNRNLMVNLMVNQNLTEITQQHNSNIHFSSSWK